MNIEVNYIEPYVLSHTAYEHLLEFEVINITERIYDPIIGRFLSPDNYIQAPDFTQSLNRYSYCWNNPLKYTDPSGEFTWYDAGAIGLILVGTAALCCGIPWGGPLIYSGIKHFDDTYRDMKYNNTSWDESSNNVGLTLGFKARINEDPSLKEKKQVEELESTEEPILPAEEAYIAITNSGRVGYSANGYNQEALALQEASSQGGNNPYMNSHGETVYTMDEFISANQGLTRKQIINQRQDRSKTFLKSQPGGPTMRYVTNPHDGRVLDMRHMLVVGKQPAAIGNLLEVFQWGTGQASGMDPQDFYSNGVGYQFYMQYNSMQNLIAPTTFTDQLNTFFNNPKVIYNW